MLFLSKITFPHIFDCFEDHTTKKEEKNRHMRRHQLHPNAGWSYIRSVHVDTRIISYILFQAVNLFSKNSPQSFLFDPVSLASIKQKKGGPSALWPNPFFQLERNKFSRTRPTITKDSRSILLGSRYRIPKEPTM